MRLTVSEFWVPQLKNLVKMAIRNHKSCILHKKAKTQQVIVTVPHERISFSYPFTRTEVEFSDPFGIT